MRTPLVDGKTPGQFRAVCNLAQPHVIAKLPEYLRREYAEKGWKKGTREVYDRSSRSHRLREVFLEPLCEGFETTDPAAFEHHMKTVHGTRNIHGENAPLVRRAQGKWHGPRAAAEGTPVKSDTPLKTCPGCGLVAEVDDRPGNVLWWAEHERMCVGDTSAVA